MLRVSRLLFAALVCLGLAAPSASAAGLLLPSGGAPLALRHHRVEIRATKGATVTTVEQVFVNDAPRQLEATYLFPLPSGAVLSDFKLQVNGVMKTGKVLEKSEAERIYLDIVRSMRDPGLVDWMGGNLFRARIFPVPARGEQRISVTYTQVTEQTAGTYRIVHPLRIPEATSRVLEDFTVTVRIKHNVPLRTIYSPSHRIAVQRRNEHEATVGFEAEKIALDRDFVLHVGVSEEDLGINVLPFRSGDDAGYFALLASPKHAFEVDALPRKAITFVLDTSGSMQGQKLARARGALNWCLERLSTRDHFNVIRFASDVESFAPGLVMAAPEAVRSARAFVDGFDAAGGTAIDSALEAALSERTGERDLPHIVVFITDGRPTVGETHMKAIMERSKRHNRERARVFVLGIGEDVETLLLDGLADTHGGATSYVKGDAKLTEQIAGLYTKLAHPVLTDLALEIRGVRTFAMNPATLPTLFKGEQLVLTGRYRGEGHALVRFSGSLNGARRTWDYEVAFPERAHEHDFLPPLWANRQVGVLLDQVRRNGETPGLKREIVQLATRFGIVTPYTSYLVKEAEVARHMQPRRAPTSVGRPDTDTMPAVDGDLRGRAESVLDEAFGYGALGKSGSGAGGGGRRARPRSLSKKAQRVSESKALRHMKEKRQAQSDIASVRYVSGRVMQLKDGVWEDGRERSEATPLRVAPYSNAWLQVRALQPELADVLALGEHVVVSLGAVDLIVEPGGAEKLSGAARRALGGR